MRCAPFCLTLFVTSLVAVASVAAAPDRAVESGFEGVWVGEIVAPNTRTDFGLAFTRTPDGLLVSVHFPAMFLHSVNFGPANLQGSVFKLKPLDLSLTLAGDRLTGTFALARLPVELRRGGTFPPALPEPDYPPAPAPVWTRNLRAGVWASPIVFADMVYVAAIDGSLHALRVADGAETWTWSGPHALYGAPLVTTDSVYVVDSRYELVALARVDGAVRWRVPLLANPDPSKLDPTFNHRFITPVIDPKGTLYVGAPDGGLQAIRASNGRRLWRHDAGAPIHAPVSLDGDNLLVGCFDGTVLAINRRTRKEAMRTKLGGPVVSSPVVAGNRIVVGARDYLLYGLDRTGEVAWRNSFWFSWIESTPRLVDGVLYIGGSDYRRVSALDPATGAQHWATDVGGLSWGSPVVTPRLVFAGTAGQEIPGTVLKHTGGIVALDRATGAPVWRYQTQAKPAGGFTGFAGSLALSEDRLIGAAVDGMLIAFPVSPVPQASADARVTSGAPWALR